VKHSRSKFLLILLLLCLSQALAQTAAAPFAPVAKPHRQPVLYIISLAKRSQHLVHVEARFPTMLPMSRDVQLPVWNALYQVRDFAQYVRSVSAHADDGHTLPVRALDKTTWHVDGGGDPFTFQYDILTDTPSPFGAQLSDEHAFLNLAEICVYMVGAKDKLIVLSFRDYPANWHVATSMEGGFAPPFPAVRFPIEKTFAASNYDQMADSPVELGVFNEQKFQDSATTWYRVVVHADSNDYDLSAVADMAHKIAVTETEWMQDQPQFPFGYTFIYHFPRRPAGGGMEHAYSTAIDASADRVKRNPLSLAGVTAHEFFHLWNVKRIRPQSLEPVDYTKEQYTRALWFSEGVTSTVADYMRVRAGYLDEKGFLSELAADIRYLESRPARLTQSVEESSLNAWLEKYPQYESPQRSISYYNKGEILGMLLDLQMREASAGKRSLRDLFLWMNDHYAKQGKFFPDSRGVEEAAEAVTGADFHEFFARYVAGTDAIPYDKFFATVGLRLDKQTVALPDPGFRTVRRPANAAIVVSVNAGSEAEKAGLRSGDIIQQVNGRAPDEAPENGLLILRIGDTVDLRVSGATGPRRVKFKLAGTPAENYALVERAGATEAQRARRVAWIRGDSQ
jgi:predicted metalloprotease with PDZ domain